MTTPDAGTGSNHGGAAANKMMRALAERVEATEHECHTKICVMEEAQERHFAKLRRLEITAEEIFRRLMQVRALASEPCNRRERASGQRLGSPKQRGRWCIVRTRGIVPERAQLFHTHCRLALQSLEFCARRHFSSRYSVGSSRYRARGVSTSLTHSTRRRLQVSHR